MAEAEEVLGLLARPANPALEQEALRLLFLALSGGFLTTFADPDRPDFVPAVNNLLNGSMTNPDFIYGTATVDGAGTYRISGERGDALFLFFDIVAGGLGVMDTLGPSLGSIDGDSLTIDADGLFELLLSAERPTDWAGDWRPLDPRARTITMRQAVYDWGRGRDPRVAIERVDRPLHHRRSTPGEVAERLAALAAYPRRYAGLWLGVVRDWMARGLWNRFEHDDWAGRGGVTGQHYYQGLFRLEPGYALLLETALPARVRYWNVQLGDLVWNTIDWVNWQSSLNGGQARLDDDGRFRAVIALDDPGVPNWLDPGGNTEGAIMLRWTEASDGPAPMLTPVRLDRLRNHLPHDTPAVTPAERDDALRRRRTGAQLRRRWEGE
ncbi:hypothetical protein FOY91_02150 [Sphingomonas solaris]|uniref:DUF1214 domain-containing protein n=1 Tax=Alterirhizorhabdus solaris TaxID=2529389 RepID=A0A558RCJ0_9SPHN|nr:hypothetical protein FOY91_02150 [Sphingomonas solaris]